MQKVIKEVFKIAHLEREYTYKSNDGECEVFEQIHLPKEYSSYGEAVEDLPNLDNGLYQIVKLLKVSTKEDDNA